MITFNDLFKMAKSHSDLNTKTKDFAKIPDSIDAAMTKKLSAKLDFLIDDLHKKAVEWELEKAKYIEAGANMAETEKSHEMLRVGFAKDKDSYAYLVLQIMLDYEMTLNSLNATDKALAKRIVGYLEKALIDAYHNLAFALGIDRV